jgi:hypothetical protein
LPKTVTIALDLGGFLNFTAMALNLSISRLLLLLCFVISAPSISLAQDDDLHPDKPREHKNRKKDKDDTAFSDKLFTGGDFGLQFGTLTVVQLSPIVGYWVTQDKLAVGAGITYQYYNNHAYKFSTSIYGGNVFTRYYFGESFFAHGEYEMLNVEAFDGFHDRVWVPGLLAGGGYRQPLGEKASFTIIALWNFTQSTYTPYNNPVIRAGINIGL